MEITRVMDVIPFKGIYFNSKKIKRLERVFCPLYDLISSDQEKTYRKCSKYNVINLILRKPSIKTEYKKARQIFQEWLDKKVLVKEKEDRIYPLEINYSNKKLKGFFALVNVKPSKVKIYAHEKTHLRPIKDRFLLLKTTQLNFCSIYLASLNSSLSIEKFLKTNIKNSESLFCIKDNSGVEFKIFSLKANSTVKDFVVSLKEFLIADGHHRFTVASKYAEFLEKRKARLANSARFILAFLTDFFQEGLYLGTFHRIVRINFKKTELLERFKKYFKIRQVNTTKELISQLNKKDSLRIGLLSSKNKFILEPTIQIKEKRFKDFNVLFLHEFLFKKVLNLDLEEKDIDYTPSLEEAFLKADDSTKIFLLKPLEKEKVLKIVKKKHLFPQKSTYFYPKLLTGLVMRDLRDGVV